MKKRPTFDEQEAVAVRAAQIVESVVGNAWATDAAGKFTYLTPAALEFFDLSLEELNSLLEVGKFGWEKVIHPDDFDGVADTWRRCLGTGEHFNLERRVLRAIGIYGWSRISGQPLRNSQDVIVGWYGTVIDKEPPSNLKTIVHRNDATVAMPALTLVHPADRPAVAQAAAYAFWTGVSQVTTYRQLQSDGNYQQAELRAEPGYEVSIAIDALISIPGQRWTMADSFGGTVEAVRAAKVIESLYGKAWAFDAAGRFTYVTPVAQTAINMTLEDLNAPVRGGAFIDGGDVGWSLGVHPDDYEAAAEKLRHCLRTGDHWNVEYRMLRATGQYVWHRISARPSYDGQGRIIGWYGTSIDIDVYKKTEAALRERERELSQLIDMVPSHVWRLRADGRPAFFNRRMVDYLGLDVSSTETRNKSRLDVFLETIHPDDVEEFRNLLHCCLETGEPFFNRYRARRSDGVYRWMSSRAEPVISQNGEIIDWYGLSTDVEDQTRAQMALRQSEQQFRQLIETLPAMIYCAAPDGEPTYRSQRLREYLGVGRKEGNVPLDYILDEAIHPDDRANVKEKYRNSLSTGEPYGLKHRLRNAEGEYRWVETRAAAMRDAEGAILQWSGVCLDIDGEMRAQEELRLSQENLARASQAASLAELSASIAHEVNQPLAAIVANSHACNRWLSAKPANIDRAKVAAERIVLNAHSAADVVSRIRALFKQEIDSRTSAPLYNAIEEVISLMADEMGRRAFRLDVSIEANLPPVVYDRVQMQQVLINLLRNGMDAMQATTRQKYIKLHLSRSANCLKTEITDLGVGIQHPERMFEPFFTTKAQGMGMGLAICRSIVESHGGRLWAEKNEPYGTKFTFTMPITV